MKADLKQEKPPALLNVNCSHPNSHPTKPAIRAAPSPSPAVSPQWPITTHPFQSTSREKRPRYTVTVCFLPTNGANRAAHSKQSTQQATLVKWYHLCFPSLQGGRNRIGFGFDSRTSHNDLFIFTPLFFLNLLLFHAKYSLGGRSLLQKHSLVRNTYTVFFTCNFRLITEHSLHREREVGNNNA